jgi:hypothetical protein
MKYNKTKVNHMEFINFDLNKDRSGSLDVVKISKPPKGPTIGDVIKMIEKLTIKVEDEFTEIKTRISVLENNDQIIFDILKRNNLK